MKTFRLLYFLSHITTVPKAHGKKKKMYSSRVPFKVHTFFFFLFFLEDGGPQILYPKILTDILQVNIQKDMILK